MGACQLPWRTGGEPHVLGPLTPGSPLAGYQLQRTFPRDALLVLVLASSLGPLG